MKKLSLMSSEVVRGRPVTGSVNRTPNKNSQCLFGTFVAKIGVYEGLTRVVLLDVGQDVEEVEDIGGMVGLPNGNRDRKLRQTERTTVEGHCKSSERSTQGVSKQRGKAAGRMETWDGETHSSGTRSASSCPGTQRSQPCSFPTCARHASNRACPIRDPC